MAVAPAKAEIIEPLQSMGDASPSRPVSDAASESSAGELSSIADPSDRPTPDHSNYSPSPSRELEYQLLPQQSLRSEEYRQLFRLPADEVLFQDFNCALQENFLLQGHMYLFVHYICFYSNLFGFETKKIIPFHEVTAVKRAKAAGIFPTAIEIMAGEKKFFFTSFLSRDEAFKLIEDGWLQHTDGSIHQDSCSEISGQENGFVVLETASNSIYPVDGPDSIDRSKEVPISEDFMLPPISEAVIPPTVSSGAQDNVEEDTETMLNSDASYSGNILNSEPSSSGKSLGLEHENSDAPKVPEYFTKVAESKFPIKVEEFYSLFFSDDAVGFLESFHSRCGDKDFKCTPWQRHDEFGHARNVSFQHPIKIYFGARFGSCQEAQKFRAYRSSHLVLETSQEINDVPYSDYFRVEGRWDVEIDDDGSNKHCILRVYTNVAFSKRTMWKGKIVQSTLEECREAYAIWIDIAHEILKQRNLEKAQPPATRLLPVGGVDSERLDKTEDISEKTPEANDTRISQVLQESNNVNQNVSDPLRENLSWSTSVASMIRGSLRKSQSHVPLLLIITFALILILMQVSIVVLLARPQQIQVIPQTECSRGARVFGEQNVETVAWMEKRIHHLKEEMQMVETVLEKMSSEHSLLKAQIKDLEYLRKQQQQ